MIAIGAEELDFLVPELLPVAIKLAFALRAGHPKNFCHGAFPPHRNKIRNSKHEIRNKPGSNKSQTQKIQNAEIRIERVLNFMILSHLNLFRISSFEFVDLFMLGVFAPLRENLLLRIRIYIAPRWQRPRQRPA